MHNTISDAQRTNRENIPTRDLLRSKKNVMGAVMLRDIRSRFFNHGLGFVIVPFFPFAHLFALSFIYQAMGRSAPFGNDTTLFFAVSLIPALVFMYVTRFMSYSLLENRSMLAFPRVKLMDIILARACLEILAILLACIGVFSLLFFIGSDPFPYKPFEAISALFFMILLSIGIGIIVCLISSVADFFVTIWALWGLLMYLLSGFLIIPAYLPQEVSYFLSFNPTIHGTEWMRTAFYLGYPDQFLDKQYLMIWAVGSIFVGLLAENLLRKKFMSS